MTSFGVFLGVEVANNSSLKRKVPHFEYDDVHGWIPSSFEGHGRRKIRISLCKEGYDSINGHFPESAVTCCQESVIDSGAMMCLGEKAITRRLNIKENDLVKSDIDIKAAKKAKISILGTVFTKIETFSEDGGVEATTRQVLYISEQVKGLYLSKKASRDLGILPSQFPRLVSSEGEKSKKEKKDAVPTLSSAENPPKFIGKKRNDSVNEEEHLNDESMNEDQDEISAGNNLSEGRDLTNKASRAESEDEMSAANEMVEKDDVKEKFSNRNDFICYPDELDTKIINN